MQVIFCSSNLPLSYVIRWFTWSQWSHVGLIDGDYVIESTLIGGVKKTPLLEFLDSHPNYYIHYFKTEKANDILNAAKSQIGKPYDFSSLFGFWFKRDWQDPSKWFCSELVAWAFEKAGEPLFRSESLGRVTPQHLWMVAK